MSQKRSSLKPLEGHDPQHGTNTVRTLVISQLMAVGITAALVALERIALWVLARFSER